MKKRQRSWARRLLPLAVAIALLTTPCPADALLFTVEGNAPQSAANYKQWSGLADVVNLPSRQKLLWCNGFESLSYAGDTDALNLMLNQYAKVECSTHTVVLRPGPLQEKYDWELHFSQGIVKFMIEKYDLRAVRDVEPTLVIYVNGTLKLESLVIPEVMNVKQLSHLREQYLQAQKSGNERTQKEATEFLKSLEEDPVRKSLGQRKYKTHIQQISEFVERLPNQQ